MVKKALIIGITSQDGSCVADLVLTNWTRHGVHPRGDSRDQIRGEVLSGG
jgi:GDP-D-mannose dehydratase